MAEVDGPRELHGRTFGGAVALVTGASRGIGAATAIAFATAGARVVLAARDTAALEEVAGRIRGIGGEALVVPMDLAVPGSIRRLGASIVEAFDRLDFAVNNAGEGYRPTPMAEVPDAAFEQVLRVGVTGTFLTMKAEIPIMLRGGGGAIVNVSSTAGASAFAGGAPYVAAKHAIVGLTKAAALDYATQHVRVNAVAPGPIDTHRLRSAPEEYREQARLAVPMRRLGEPEEVAAAILWLCSDSARFVTGTTLTVDGGRLAGFA
ncbi:MAG: glucose 1-dehydrogenase [Thermoplasmata archaeon]|nr:glucose 1-dehydrogenase [Thermoplasmata archaeon]